MANILGVKTGQLDKKECEEMLDNFFSSLGTKQIVTPNPEIILQAQKDEELFYILNQAELSLADGFGLKIVACLSKQKLYRQTGADLLPKLLHEANQAQRKVIIINRADGLSAKSEIEEYLNSNYPDIDYLLLDSLVKNCPSKEELININLFAAELVICLFGAPYQEKYVNSLKNNVNEVKIGVGLGGAFDFLTGKIKRAPKLMRQLGLEWLWRLIQQPKRIARIYRATVVFFLQIS